LRDGNQVTELTQKQAALAASIESTLGSLLTPLAPTAGQLSYVVSAEGLLECCRILRDERPFQFEMLMDLCGVDYMTYGGAEWQTLDATSTGFSRGVVGRGGGAPEVVPEGPGFQPPGRFAVVYQLLSITLNQRLRIKVFAPDDSQPMVDSVTPVWASADWFEREAFDLFGILFRGHADLRRLLTDYGFIGHPFRKDFPLIGNVEMRYDPERGRVVYEPVSIEPRTLVPRVIRDDNRYTADLKDTDA
jgi:NADH-quinone oxidoreductase subunit C